MLTIRTQNCQSSIHIVQVKGDIADLPGAVVERLHGYLEGVLDARHETSSNGNNIARPLTPSPPSVPYANPSDGEVKNVVATVQRRAPHDMGEQHVHQSDAGSSPTLQSSKQQPGTPDQEQSCSLFDIVSLHLFLPAL